MATTRLLPSLAALLLTAFTVCETVRAAAPPNLVFIIADDCTFRDIGCYGGQAYTPNIDRLATEGMQFSQCHQSAPMCSPTRHNIYTGLYPVKSGAYPNHTFAKDGTKSIVHYLKPLGYRVALSGKTHIGPGDVFPFEYSGKNNNPDMDAIETFMQQSIDSQTPFCLFACSNEPHSPWNKGDASRYPPVDVKLPPYIVDTPQMREDFSHYLAEITYYDDQVGQILALIDKMQARDNTLVMVVSEQGNSFPFAKWTCYGNGLQSAMIVRWPGQVAAGSTTDALVEYTDVTPTFVEAAGGVPDSSLDGQSFVDVLTGKADKHKAYTFGEMTTRGIINGSDVYGIRSVRGWRYRLIWNLNHEVKFQNACTQAGYFRSMVDKAESGDETARELVDKYLYRPEFELYDCETDPLEMNNLAGDPKLAKVQARLKEQLDQWMQSQGDQGKETEERALLRQKKFVGMTMQQAVDAWQNKGRVKGKKGKAAGKKKKQ
tara:strand:+ start:173829 stop:175292 length:1464 start_codon:yes stop_codon:yes gene_type:complete